MERHPVDRPSLRPHAGRLRRRLADRRPSGALLGPQFLKTGSRATSLFQKLHGLS
jgi:hypothetical protein